MKTYAIADIHGQLNRYLKFKKDIDPEDRVYILGDVIDKGPGSMEILLDIMENPNYQMLLGNHEYMMLNYLDALDRQDNYDIKEYGDIWLYFNYGYETFSKYECLTETKKKEVKDFLKNLPIVIPSVCLNDKTYYLVHSNPYKDSDDIIYLNNDNYDVERFIWDRVPYPYEKEMIRNKIVIGGHTPSLFYDKKGQILSSAYYINIDCGCAASIMPNSHLAALCLDDLSVKYYD